MYHLKCEFEYEVGGFTREYKSNIKTRDKIHAFHLLSLVLVLQDLENLDC